MKSKQVLILPIVLFVTSLMHLGFWGFSFMSIAEENGQRSRKSSPVLREEVNPRANSLSSILSGLTMTMLREAIMVHDIHSPPTSKIVNVSFGKVLPGQGTDRDSPLPDQKESLLLDEVNITVLPRLDISGAEVAVLLNPRDFYNSPMAFQGTDGLIYYEIPTKRKKRNTYMIAEATISGPVFQEMRIWTRQGRKSSVKIQEIAFKNGTYHALNSKEIALVYDRPGEKNVWKGASGTLIAVLTEQGNSCDVYLATESEITDTITVARREKYLPTGSKVVFSSTTLEKGTYRTLNGVGCFLLFNQENKLRAVLNEETNGWSLYISTDAIVSGTIPDSALKSGTYEALIVTDSAGILNSQGDLIMWYDF